MDKPTRIQVIIWGMLLIASVTVSLIGFQYFQLAMYKDSHHYIILAHSLVHFDEYGYVNVPHEPDPTKFPFGYPLLLAVIIRAFPDNLSMLRLVSLIATVLNITLIFWGWSWFSRLSHWWGLAVVGLYGLAIMTTRYSQAILSEPIFLTFCLATMLLTAQAARSKLRRWWSFLMSIALILVVFTRTIGLALMITVFMYLFFTVGRKFLKESALIVVQMALLAGLIVSATSVEAGDLLPLGYVKEAIARTEVRVEAGLAQTKLDLFVVRRPVWFINYGLGLYLRQAILPFGGGEYDQALSNHLGIASLLGYFILGLTGLGYFRWLSKEGISVFNLFPFVYLVTTYFWVWSGSRLFIPILPQLYLGLVLGMDATLRLTTLLPGRMKFSGNLRNGILATAVVILMIISGSRSVINLSTDLPAGDLQIRSNWLKSNTDSSAIVMTEWPYLDFIYSHRNTVSYPKSVASSGELKTHLLEHKVDYILIAPELNSQLYNTPTYSNETIQLLLLIEHLISENRANLVYAFEPDLIKVFKIQSEAK